jgi:hypothetical protein
MKTRTRGFLVGGMRRKVEKLINPQARFLVILPETVRHIPAAFVLVVQSEGKDDKDGSHGQGIR